LSQASPADLSIARGVNGPGWAPGAGRGTSEEHSPPPRSEVPATPIRPTKPDAGRSIPTDDALGKYARTLPFTPLASWYVDPSNGMEPVSDRIDQQAETGAEFQEAMDAAPGAIEARGGTGEDEGKNRFAATSEREPVNRAPFPRIVQPDAASELTMSRAFTMDRTLSEQAIGAAWSGFPEALGQGDRPPRASNAQTMNERNRGSERRPSPLADTSTAGSGKETMVAVTEELERLRSAARQTADELQKVRGPVPPAFPSRPPAFRDRS
jgi:hypothetical protein